MVEFIRAELNPDAERFPFTYFWKCNCGKEYTTKTGHFPTSLCEDCRKAEKEERKKIAAERAENKYYKKVVANIKKQFSFSKIPTITVDGEKYYQAKAVKKTIDLILGEEGDRENGRD